MAGVAPSNLPELVSLRKLSRITGFAPATLRHFRDNEGMPVYPIAGRQLVILSEWWEWVRSHKRQPDTK